MVQNILTVIDCAPCRGDLSVGRKGLRIGKVEDLNGFTPNRRDFTFLRPFNDGQDLTRVGSGPADAADGGGNIFNEEQVLARPLEISDMLRFLGVYALAVVTGHFMPRL